MSGESPLFRIGMTCAAIIIGCAIIGSQLASTGNLSQVVSSVADEDEGTIEDGASAGSSYDPDHVGGGSDDEVYAEEPDEEPDDDAYEDGEVEGESSDHVEEGSDDDGGFVVVRRKP